MTVDSYPAPLLRVPRQTKPRGGATVPYMPHTCIKNNTNEDFKKIDKFHF